MPAAAIDPSGPDGTNAKIVLPADRERRGATTRRHPGMERVRRFLRNYTALAVREHLRSEVEARRASPNLTENELELVRFIVGGSFDWNAFLCANLWNTGSDSHLVVERGKHESRA